MGEVVEGDFFLNSIGNTLHLKTDKYNFTSNNFERGENDGDIIVKTNNQTVYLGISLKDQLNLIGTICLWNFSQDCKTTEVGYELLPEYHRQGIMCEALKVLNFGFNELNILEKNIVLVYKLY
ncbi:acetyltransferase (GNAT) family protein [Chryseobacterium sp. 7]|uniref:GNAT family N-acetyltransferase n=1 Tax=Chryseobacterium sp. 7 TaxID=2035214 RepID=UPI000EB35061|nr:GNAT family N-acetyltransferase [Chryseobacterium sp. 7]RLJ30734.1 acetyltransferase (GNAT) family protein [Chryseobacterium sp. 7]